MIGVLYVDDDVALLEIGKVFLERENLKIDTATSGNDALDMMAHKKYDAIISDYQMPVMDGIELLKRVRDGGDDITFILFTGKGREEIVIEAFDSGADFYVQKGGDARTQFIDLAHKVKAGVDRRIAECTVGKQKVQLEALIDSSDKIIFSVDREYRYTAFNKLHKKMMNMIYGVDIQVGMNQLDYQTVDEDRIRVKRNLDRALAGERFLETAISGDSEHSLIEFEVEHSPIRSPSGEVIGVAVFASRLTERRQTEEAFKVSRQRYEALFSAYNEGIALHEIIYEGDKAVDYRIIEVNSSFQRLTNIPKEAVIGELASKVYKTTPPPYLDIYTKVAETGEPLWFETHFPPMSKDFLISVFSPVRGQFATVFMDITDRKLAEAGLKESEMRYRSLFVDNSAPMLIIDPSTGDIVNANQTACEFYGYQMDQLLKMNISDINMLGKDGVTKEMGLSVAGMKRKFEFKHRLANGEVRDVEVYSGPIDMVGRKLLYSIIHDVTDRARMETALKESEVKFRNIFNNANDSILVYELDRNGMAMPFYDVNETGIKLLGYSRSELLSMRPMQLSNGHFEPALETILDDLRTKGKAIFFTELNTRDGKLVEVEMNAHVYTVQDKHFVITLARDISETKRNMDALRIANKKLNLLSSITRHDVKNQLMVLYGNLEIMSRSEHDPKFDAPLHKAMSIAERISNMIQFTKDYEEIGVKAAAWQNLSTLIDLAESQQSLRNCKIINQVDRDVEIYADPLIQKVFYNLIDNAMRYGQTATSIRFYLEKGEGVEHIICQDNGVGVKPQMKPVLFRRGQGLGHGLGLFLSSEILDITGIKMTEEGEPGKGAKFVLTVPNGGIRTMSN